MINNLNSVDRIINKIIVDLGLGHSEIPHNSFIEWIADALEHIGSYYQFEEKECNILIEDFHGILPCDFYKPIRFKEGCSVRAGEGGFYGGSLQSLLNKAGVDYESLPAYERFSVIPVAGLSTPNKGSSLVDTVTGRLNFNKNLIGGASASKLTDSDYNVNFNKITAGFQFGIINLQYLAIPTDDRGYPLVPDDVSFRDALFWKCAYHIAMLNPTLIPNPTMRDLQYCESRWLKYCAQARASANMPDLAMLERLKNNFVRLHNNVDYQETGYAQNGKKQFLT